MSEPVPSTVTESWPCCSNKDDKNKIIKTEAALQRCSENMQQIHKQTPMPKCHFSKVALLKFSNFIEIKLRHGCSPVNLLEILGKTPLECCFCKK